ncbi:hypothetical protein R6Q59_034417 [Mikania micrantha]
MGTKLRSIPLQTIFRGWFQHIGCRSTHSGVVDQGPDLAAVLEKKLNAELPTQTSNGAFIYKVPDRLRSVEPKAYEPNIVSIGPYHHGLARLQAMEDTKWRIFQKMFNPSEPNRPNLKAVLKELKEMEPQARGCYFEDLKISSMQFNKMMLYDSCFIIELLRKTRQNNITFPRWMLPVLRRDLIMLENQLPMFVLNKVYGLTRSSTCEAEENFDLKELAVQYFEPMIYKDYDPPKTSALCVEEDGEKHFLELFRASICPTRVPKSKLLVKEPHMFRSIRELKESGVKIKKAENCQQLDVSFKKGVLKIAPVTMDDCRFTLFRNMVAFEQCHHACRPHVTAYVFFLDRLINSAEDIELLHYSGVMQHTFGGNKIAAKLVNKLCKELAGAVDDSYLQDVIWKINCYCNNGWNQNRAKLKHEYFYNIWVSLSTMAAILMIYLTMFQTVTGFGDESARAHIFGAGFWATFAEAFVIPLRLFKPSLVPAKDELRISLFP